MTTTKFKLEKSMTAILLSIVILVTSFVTVPATDAYADGDKTQQLTGYQLSVLLDVITHEDGIQAALKEMMKSTGEENTQERLDEGKAKIQERLNEEKAEINSNGPESGKMSDEEFIKNLFAFAAENPVETQKEALEAKKAEAEKNLAIATKDLEEVALKQKKKAEARKNFEKATKKLEIAEKNLKIAKKAETETAENFEKAKKDLEIAIKNLEIATKDLEEATKLITKDVQENIRKARKKSQDAENQFENLKKRLNEFESKYLQNVNSKYPQNDEHTNNIISYMETHELGHTIERHTTSKISDLAKRINDEYLTQAIRNYVTSNNLGQEKQNELKNKLKEMEKSTAVGDIINIIMKYYPCSSTINDDTSKSTSSQKDKKANDERVEFEKKLEESIVHLLVCSTKIGLIDKCLDDIKKSLDDDSNFKLDSKLLKKNIQETANFLDVGNLLIEVFRYDVFSCSNLKNKKKELKAIEDKWENLKRLNNNDDLFGKYTTYIKEKRSDIINSVIGDAGLPMASSFENIEVALKALQEVVRNNKNEIISWYENETPGSGKKNIVVPYKGNAIAVYSKEYLYEKLGLEKEKDSSNVSREVKFSNGNAFKADDACISLVLSKSFSADDFRPFFGFKIVTCYPTTKEVEEEAKKIRVQMRQEKKQQGKKQQEKKQQGKKQQGKKQQEKQQQEKQQQK